MLDGHLMEVVCRSFVALVTFPSHHPPNRVFAESEVSCASAGSEEAIDRQHALANPSKTVRVAAMPFSLSPHETDGSDCELETVSQIHRPHRDLLVHYTLRSLPFFLFPPLGVLIWVVQYFRYHTLFYQFSDQGITMRWGILFRREIILNYSRIQDIQLVSGFIERWLGLARIHVQTASGSATPEMTIEGLKEYEMIRNFVYGRMRGTRTSNRARSGSVNPQAITTTAFDHGTNAVPAEEVSSNVAASLREVAAELRLIRSILQGAPESDPTIQGPLSSPSPSPSQNLERSNDSSPFVS